MAFLLTSLLLVCANLWSARFALTPSSSRSQKGISFLHLLTGQAFAVSFLFTLVTLGKELVWFVAGVLTLGLGSAVLFGMRLVPALGYTDHSPFRWRSGLSLWAVLAGLYLAFTALDHWAFFWESEQSGIVDASMLDVESVPCDKLVLVNHSGKEADWRCPGGVAIGDVMSGRVFAPWPSYESGSSLELKRRLESVMAEARRVE